jgi:hypothetical protein
LAHDVTPIIGANDDRIEAKLRHHLATTAARRATIGSNDRNGVELSLTGRYCREDGGPLGAHGLGESSILDVDASERPPSLR